MLIAIQTYRSEQSENALKGQAAPKVQVTSNAPPAQIVLTPPLSEPRSSLRDRILDLSKRVLRYAENKNKFSPRTPEYGSTRERFEEAEFLTKF
jgi:hypothetical protein